MKFCPPLHPLIAVYALQTVTAIIYIMHWLQNEEIIDEFVIYGDKYSQIQELVSRTIYGGMVQQHEIMPKVW